MMDDRTKEQKQAEAGQVIKRLVDEQHPTDPAALQQRSAQHDATHRTRILGNLVATGAAKVRYQNRYRIIAGWGEQNFKQHWWIEGKQPGMIKAACGILSTKDNVQWSEHLPGLARCQVCQDFEIKDLKARAQRPLPSGGAE